jgi:prevent-host-death family protein
MPSSKSGQTPRAGRWSLETAKARFSEVVRHARSEGPQRVTVRGRDSVVILSAEDYERLTAKGRKPFVDFLESLDLHGLDLERNAERGRDVEL